MPNGGELRLTESGAGSNHYVADAGSDAVVDYSTGTTQYTLTATDKTSYVFDSAGKLLSRAWLDGDTWTYTYASGKLSTVADGNGRQLQFAYISNVGQFNNGLLWRVGDQDATGLATSCARWKLCRVHLCTG